MRRIAFSALLLSLAPWTTAYAADFSDGEWLSDQPLRGAYVHLGVLATRQADDGTLTAGGVPVAGARYDTELGFAAAFEAGYVLDNGLGIAVSGMTPVTTPNVAAGALAGTGNLGDETVGYYSATLQYHAKLVDRITPYVGVGLGYMHVFSTQDGAVTNFAVNSAFGGVVQAGVDLELTDNLGIYADVKHYFISTTATGDLGAAPVVANARVDPWVVSTGISMKF